MMIGGVSLFAAGWLFVMIGGIMLLIAGFRQGVGWGLAMLFLSPIAQLVFFFTHWDEARKSFFVQMLGMLLLLGGSGALLRGGFDVSGATESFSDLSFTNRATLMSGLADAARGSAETADRPRTLGANDNFVGRKLEEVVAVLGEPKMLLKVGHEATYRYPDLDLYSSDGVYVTSQGVPTK